MQPDNAITVAEYKRMAKEPLAVVTMRGMLRMAPELGDVTIREEFIFHPSRKWRFDFAAPFYMVAVEVEGLVWSPEHGTGKSRHTENVGYTEDCLKYSEAAALGWLVIRATPTMVRYGDALRLFCAAIALRREEVR